MGVNSAWADDWTTVYTRAAVTDWTSADATDWNGGESGYLSVSETFGLGATSNLTASSTKSFTIADNSKVKYVVEWTYGGAPGRDVNYDYIQFGDKIRLGMNNSYFARLSTDAGSTYGITDYGNKASSNTYVTATISLIFDTSTKTVESFLFNSTDLTSAVSALTLSTFNTITMGFTRGGSTTYAQYNYIKTITVSELKQAVTTADYTINYQLSGTTVKTFAGTSVVGAEITADIAIDGTEEGYVGNHYLITAAEAPSMTLVADAASNVLNVPVRAPYTATLNVTRTIGGVAQSPVVTNLTETDAKVCSWVYTYPMYVQKDGVYYVADETASFGESGNFTDGQTINKTVAYTNPDYSVVYYGEPNEAAGTNTSYSNGNVGYIKGGVVYSSNDVIRLGQLAAGTYRLITNVTGDAGRNVVVGDYTAGTESFPTALVTITTTGVKDETFTVDGTQLICISGKDQGSGKFNQSATLDYILVKASTQKKAITDAGWATLYTEYPLDFSGVDGLTAYTATYNTSTKKVELTQVNDIQANTGVVLKGAEKTYNIPVAASSSTASGELRGAATATAYDAYAGYDLYMLSKNGDNAQFKKVTSGSIAAGKAFLMIEQSGGAPTLDIDFGDATAIEVVKNAETKGMGEFYNLAGQRVAQPTKGLYIVNGKKVVIK